jgi:Outer membrane protein beta-barrel domain
MNRTNEISPELELAIKTRELLFMKLILKSIILSLISVDAAFALEQPVADVQPVDENNSIREYFDEAEDATPAHSAHPSRLAQATDAAEAGAAVGAAAAPAVGAAVDAAAGTGVKKKKKKKAGAPTPGAPGEATLGHGLQESGLPYSANVDLNLQYSSTSQTIKYSDTSSKVSSTAMTVSTGYYWVLGPTEIGPKIAILSQTDKSPNATTPANTDMVKTSAIGFGAGAAFNIGNIHQSKLVPYIGLDILSTTTTTTSTTSGSTNSTKVTNSAVELGLAAGLKIFMGGHVALKPYLNYQILMSGSSKEEITGSDAVVASVTGNTLSLGMGLATYF